MRNLPANTSEISELASLVPSEGNTPFHKHADRLEIFELLALVCLDGRMVEGGRMEWADIANELNDDFPGLQCTGGDVQRFCQKHIIPNVYLPRSYVLRGIIEKGQSLDMLGQLMDLNEGTRNAFMQALETMGQITEGSDGRLVKTGASASEVASLARAAAALHSKMMDELERYNLLPEKKQAQGPRVDVNVNVGAAMGNLMGRGAAIDAEYKDKGE